MLININDQADWNGKIIFSPNATGKTRLSNALYDVAIAHNIRTEIMTARTILDLIALNRNDIFVGKASKEKAENFNLEKVINSEKLLNEIFLLYKVKNATELKKKSLTFSNVTNDRLLDFLEKTDLLNLKDEDLTYQISFNEALMLDCLFTVEDSQFITQFSTNEDLKEIVSKGLGEDRRISQEKFDFLKIIYQSISSGNSVCPLCGYDYGEYDTLISKIKDYLSGYSIDENRLIFELIDRLWDKILDKNDLKVFEKYSINLKRDISYYEKMFEIIKFGKLIEDVRFIILKEYKQKIENLKVEESITKYFDNEKLIKNEEQRIKNAPLYYQDIIVNFKKLANLPPELELEIMDSKLFIKNNNESKSKSVVEYLSESEIKRLSLAVLKAQIIHANIEYIIFDDPIDSYDDYFSKRASKFIAQIINENQILKWTVTTHVFELVHILNQNIFDLSQVCNIFYYYNPSYKYDPNRNSIELLNCVVDKNQINALTEHETILIKRVLKKEKKYCMDNDFSILSVIPTIRNVLKDVIPEYAVTYKHSKIRNELKNVENRYMHYSDFSDYHIFELIRFYKKIFLDINPNIFVNLDVNLSCNKSRENILNKDFNLIGAKNPLLKSIFYNVLRVSYCKYIFEKKLIDRMKKYSYPTEQISEIFKTSTIGEKIKKVINFENKLGMKSNFAEFDVVHDEFSSIINDFSHATVRMFPPYLSISAHDIAKLEYNIKNL